MKHHKKKDSLIEYILRRCGLAHLIIQGTPQKDDIKQ